MDEEVKKVDSMNRMTKYVAAGLGAVLAFTGMAGCGNSNGVQKTKDGRVKIVMWHGFSEKDGKTLEKIVKEFNASQKKYEIDAQLQPWSTIGETMITKVASGNGPDVVTTGADNGQGWSIDGTFQCIQDFYDNKANGTDKFYKTATSQSEFTIDGKKQQCAIPMAIGPTVVWYNTDMWKAAGLTEADYPKTWDQLLEVAKKLTKADGSQYGFAMPDAGWGAYYKGNGTGVYSADGKATFDSAENKAFLEKMRAFFKAGYAKAGLDDTKAREAFESGKAAMVVSGPWEDAAATDKGIKHDFFPVPTGEGTYTFPDGSHGSNTGSTGLYFWMTSQVKDKEKKAGLYDFFKYWGSHDAQVEWSLGSAYPPNNTTVTEDDLSSRPMVARMIGTQKNAFIALQGLKGGFGDIAATIDGVTSTATRTNKDLGKALSDANKKIEGYLKEYAAN